jgi:putative membrane protein
MNFQKDNLKIVFVYVLFGFGGLWHALGLFQNAMRILASPLIIVVSLLLVFDLLRWVPKASKHRFLLWCFLVLCFGWGIECLGVHTHLPFGQYRYGNVLQPQFFNVPIPIGFSWLTITLSSLVIAFQIMSRYLNRDRRSIYLALILTAILMVGFDVVMEKSAPKLDYWIWLQSPVPVQNYLFWFGLGALFSWVWFRLRISIDRTTSFATHVYLAQLIYFLLVLFK